ncbi:MAG: hypothetical protein H6811_00185 [Phycisphaeraceae bacterium]|nr:hypothetical protein [Phycisphaeraceae bacterium]
MRRLTRLVVGGGLMAAGACLAGCVIPAMYAMAARTYEENTPRKVSGEYDGLAERSFAVVVTSERSLQLEFPSLVPEVSARVSQLIAEGGTASGYVPAEEVLRYQTQNPSWFAMTRADLAQALGGVERLVLIEISDFRLREPGNRHLWEGVASGRVAVIEADGPLSEEYAFERVVRVGFPDKSGYGPDDFGPSLVASVLAQRFSNRAGWLFFNHEEPPGTEY